MCLVFSIPAQTCPDVPLSRGRVACLVWRLLLRTQDIQIGQWLGLDQVARHTAQLAKNQTRAKFDQQTGLLQKGIKCCNKRPC